MVVLAQSVTLFLFASTRLQHAMVAVGLPAIPLVPVSSSQAVVGAILGIGLLKGGRGIRFNVLGGIAAGWVATPVAAGVLALLLLFVMDNVFDQRVTARSPTDRHGGAGGTGRRGCPPEGLDDLGAMLGFSGTNALAFKTRVEKETGWGDDEAAEVVAVARVTPLRIEPAIIAESVDGTGFGEPDHGRARPGRPHLRHTWAFHRDLAADHPRVAAPRHRRRATGRATGRSRRKLALPGSPVQPASRQTTADESIRPGGIPGLAAAAARCYGVADVRLSSLPVRRREDRP